MCVHGVCFGCVWVVCVCYICGDRCVCVFALYVCGVCVVDVCVFYKYVYGCVMSVE